MTVSNSSISSSDSQIKPVPFLTGRRVAVALLWTLFWLVLIDILLNVQFSMPKSPLEQPSKLQNYFDYGRSVEGKFRLMVGPDKESTALIAQAGWLVDDAQDQQPSVASAPDKLLIAAYGQSFTQQICHSLQSLDSRIELRFKGGPSSTLAHSYAYYKFDASHHRADIVVLGILASSLPFSMAPTIATLNFEGAAPYTYPFYSLMDGQLVENDPLIHSLDELRTALWSKPEQWDAYVAMLRSKSPTFNGWVFESDWFDYSVLGKMVRRSIGQKHVHDVTARYWNAQGFTNADGLLDISNALIADFVSKVRAKNQMPYILLIQDKGYKDHLVLAFEKQLKQMDVPYLSTHQIAPSTNMRNFVSDGHFTPRSDCRYSHGFS
ncbi:hypothetical protein [Methylomonas sp. AM2-LC]|uniref:hypothetical protein n=1 Tax=Methylomonas sp. AM2-LC TaxID=3153301 RepID=UPI00326646FC